LLPLFLPFAVLAIPLSDLVLAVIRRIAKGKSPFSPDKEHLHHRLMSAGKTQQRTAIIMYLATATVAFPVTIAAFEPIWVAAISAIVLLTITIVVFRAKFEKVEK
jgi:UDP-GlcNAc:undecaprenyl-phosphate GlcNAc-1-phosphate transferase